MTRLNRLKSEITLECTAGCSLVLNWIGDRRGRYGRTEFVDGSCRTLRSRQGIERVQARRHGVLLDHARLRDLRSAHSRRHHPLPDRWRVAGDEAIRYFVPVLIALGAVS